MVGKLIVHKWGEFLDDKTGEMKPFDNIYVMGLMTNKYDKDTFHSNGYMEQKYSILGLGITDFELEDMFGKTVIIDFDQVVGKKNPSVVKIRLAEEGGEE